MKKPIEISSAANAQFKIWKSLLSSKGIKENQLFILMGSKLIEEFLKSINPEKPAFQIEFLLRTAEQNTPALINKLNSQNLSHLKEAVLPAPLFTELDVLGTHSPLLVLSFKNFALKNMNDEPEGLEVICPLGDPRNLGALTRSAQGFGAREIILTQESAHPYLPHSIKASAGAVLQLQFKRTADKISALPLVGENFALELHGEKIHTIKWPKNIRIWIGEEGPGLQLELSQKKKMKFVHIPTNSIESLNATVSASIAFWEWKKTQL